MHRLTTHNQSLLMACGNGVERLGGRLVELLALTHSLSITTKYPVENRAIFTLPFTQLLGFLYTLFEQANRIFVPVSGGFVHIIHIAYKEGGYLKKGTY